MRVQILLCLLLTTGLAFGQKTATKKAPVKKTAVKSKPAEDLPPPMEMEAPEQSFAINFDTTAAPNDSLTAKIQELLTLTRALNRDVDMAEKSLNASAPSMQDNPMFQTFKTRFIFEMREGRARRWLTNLYIRQYRNLFTAAEIQALINFYETPVGKTVMEKQAVLSGNVMQEAQQIGQYLGGTIMQEILKEQSKK